MKNLSSTVHSAVGSAVGSVVLSAVGSPVYSDIDFTKFLFRKNLSENSVDILQEE